jgi:hypothetical protein
VWIVLNRAAAWQLASMCVLESLALLQWESQASARCHRLGQQQPVHVYRLVIDGTFDDKMQVCVFICSLAAMRRIVSLSEGPGSLHLV